MKIHQKYCHFGPTFRNKINDSFSKFFSNARTIKNAVIFDGFFRTVGLMKGLPEVLYLSLDESSFEVSGNEYNEYHYKLP